MTAADSTESSAHERATIGRPKQFKPKHDFEATRRFRALAAQQHDARASRISDVRRIAMEALLGSQENDLEATVQVEAADEDLEDVPGMMPDADTEMDSRPNGRNNQSKLYRIRQLTRTLFFARQLQNPDWMVQPPDDLSTSWLVVLRPEGDRCLLLSNGGRVEVRRKNGYVLERYTDSRMPAGLTILDVVCMEGLSETSLANKGAPVPSTPCDIELPDFDGDDDLQQAPEEVQLTSRDQDHAMGDASPSTHQNHERRGKGKGKGKGKGRGRRGRPQGDRSYAVVDVLVWGDTELVNADAECRFFWLASRSAELPNQHSRRARSLQFLPAAPATHDTLSQLYLQDFGYAKDSFLFFHRQGQYAMEDANTPLVLYWRDRQLNRFVVDTPDPTGEKIPDQQAVVLELRGSGHLRTADHIIVAKLTEEMLQEVQKLSQGKIGVLLRFEASTIDMTAKTVSGLKPIALVPTRSRIWPDSWGRIVFQHLHRCGKAAAFSHEALTRAASGCAALPQC